MAEPFLGEIRMFAGNFAPYGWALCEGQLIPISENDALFSLIGTTYGGDGETTFALPDLRGRIPVHQGNGFAVGRSGGSEQVMLLANQSPVHSHLLQASRDTAGQSAPSGNVLARTTGSDIYAFDLPVTNMSPSAISFVGGSQPHENIQPFLCVNFIIALFGIFPSQE